MAVDASKLVVEEEAKEAPPPHPDCHIGSTAPKWMARCIHVFRDPLKKEIKSSLPEPVHFVDRLKRYAAPYSDFLVSEGAQAVLRRVYEEAATATVGGDDDANDAEAKAQAQGLDSEMVTEQEQEQEQEQEEEQQMQIQVRELAVLLRVANGVASCHAVWCCNVVRRCLRVPVMMETPTGGWLPTSPIQRSCIPTLRCSTSSTPSASRPRRRH